MPRPRPPQEASSPKPALPRKLCGPQVHPLRVCSLPSAHTGPCLRPLGAQRTGRGPAARGPALGAGGRLPLWTRPGLPCTAVGTARGTHTAVPWATWAPPSCCSTQSAASPRRRPHALPGAAALWPPERLSWGRVAALTAARSAPAAGWVLPEKARFEVGSPPFRHSAVECGSQPSSPARLAGPLPPCRPLFTPGRQCLRSTEPWVLMKSTSAVSCSLLLFLVP